MYSKLNQLSAVKQEVYVCQYCIELHYEITQFLEKYELENNALIWCIPKHVSNNLLKENHYEILLTLRISPKFENNIILMFYIQNSEINSGHR